MCFRARPSVVPRIASGRLDAYYLPDPSNPGFSTSDPFGSVDIKRDIGSSTYNALGLSLERRFSAGPIFPVTIHLVALHQRRLSRRWRIQWTGKR